MSAHPDPAPIVPRPSGTVTFAFTDIEGSTRRWDRHAAAMQDAVRRHDVLMRAAIAQHAGYVFKTIGDAFCAAFARPQDAVAAMLLAQRTLAAEDFAAVDGLGVRAAIHTGQADERDGDYFGSTLNRVARLVAIGHGGQVLVSGVTFDLLLEHGTQTHLLDLGRHRLKDLAQAERVYQLVAPELRTLFPPLRSLDAVTNNLPFQLTSFVGRDAEIAAITALLDEHRLVTLVGSGGVGKTRTALQVAANVLTGFGDGVWFIELAPLPNGQYIAPAVAQAAGVSIPPDGDSVESLARALAAKAALLVFDNCEHLVASAAATIAAILRGSAKVKILASSRQGLGIAGEMIYRLPSLAIPDDTLGTQRSARDTLGYAAPALFVERARAADNRFLLTDENASTIAEICRRLDGIPLAIELAAARVKILSPRQLRGRLDERFRVLTGGGRDLLPRQQTLRALIDWSHDLLDSRERTLFRRLGTFVNSFTLEAAVAVGRGGDLEELDVFDLLASLVDKSLVLAEPVDDTVRYRLLESTRVYAREKLAAADESASCNGLLVRHLRDRFRAADAAYERTARRAELDALFTAELDDLRAALDRAVDGTDMLAGAQLLDATSDAWDYLGMYREGVARIERYLEVLPVGHARLHARLWNALSMTAGNAGRSVPAFEAATRAVAYARACDDGPMLASALGKFAESAATLGRYETAEAALGEAEAIHSPSAPERLRLLLYRATLSSLRGDSAAAISAYERLREEQHALGNRSGEVRALMNGAEIEYARGSTERAVANVRAALAVIATDTNRQLRSMLLGNLAGYLVAAGDVEAGCRAGREAIRGLAAAEPTSPYATISLEHLALGLALGGDHPRAALLAGYVDAAMRGGEITREFTEQTTHDRLAALLQERLGGDELERRRSEGAGLTAEAAIALALEEP